MNRVLVIAEAGVNHNGSMQLAEELVASGAAAGVDVVKFQTFKTELLVTASAKQASYQVENIGGEESQFAMLKRLELDRTAHERLIAHCRISGVEFLSTAFDDESLELLRSFQPNRWKVPSGEINNLPFLRKLGSFGSSILLSTGMATLGEIEVALDALVASGTRQDDITVLHCTTEYPTPWSDVNLRAMVSIREAFQVSVGYSDHTKGIEVAIAAVALGATVIEKHFTLDKSLPGPDHKASLEPNELKAMVDAIRHLEIALGNGVKRPTKIELENRKAARKSVVAAGNIRTGEIYTPNSFSIKRPGTGLEPGWAEKLIGGVARRDYKPDELIEL